MYTVFYIEMSIPVAENYLGPGGGGRRSGREEVKVSLDPARKYE